jgi:hypothetical protein
MVKGTMLFLGLLSAMSQATGLDVPEPRVLMNISEYGEIRNVARNLSTLSEFRKIMLVDALGDMLGDNSKVRLDGYVFRAGEPDLRIAAGRAEWFIDQIVLLPREAENSVSKSQRIEMWKGNIASRRTVTPQQVEVLKTKYAGKIHPGIVGAKERESIQNLENFLDEWFPYGKSLQEMEKILNVSLPVENGEAVLRIDSGFGGQEHRFLLDRGTIRVVKRRFGN